MTEETVRVEFMPSIYARAPIVLTYVELYPDRGDVRVAEYVHRSGRPVAVAELAEALGVYTTTARYHA